MKGCWVLVAFLGFQSSAQEEYKAKREKIAKTTASKHFAIGDYLSTAQQHFWARDQYRKAIDFDPDHEGARKKLGYKKTDQGWEDDLDAKQDFKNKAKKADEARILKSYNERLDSAGKDIARLWNELASWCKQNKLEAEMIDAYRRVIEYDPGSATARKELGYEKDAKGVWISKAERELRKEMRDGLVKAPQGAVSGAQTEVERALSLKERKRESGHFLIESPSLSDQDLSILIQHAEHAYAMYHKIFDQTELFQSNKMDAVILKDKDQHLAYVEAFDKGSPAQKALARKSHGLFGFPRSECFQDGPTLPPLEDWVVHLVAQTLSHLYVGGQHLWIHEGIAYHFTRIMKETAMTYCVDLAGTTPGSEGKNYQDPKDWPIVCKVWVREGKDPDLTTILKRTNLAELTGAETVKAWSVVEFLLSEHHAKFMALLHELKEGAEIDKALKTVWDWSIGDLDYRWTRYVKTNYQ
jgi:hypothetical protein